MIDPMYMEIDPVIYRESRTADNGRLMNFTLYGDFEGYECTECKESVKGDDLLCSDCQEWAKSEAGMEWYKTHPKKV